MTNALLPSSSSELPLWRAGFETFARGWKELLPIAILLIGIAALSNFLLETYLTPFNLQLAALNAQKNPAATTQLLKDNGGNIAVVTGVVYFLILAEHYVLLAFFMNRELAAETTKPSIRQFFCFAAVTICFGLLLGLMGLGIALVGGIAIAVTAASPIGKALITIIFAPVFLAGLVYLLTRYCLVMPLAAGQIAKPFKTSLVLTKGYFWRLLGNYCLIMLITLGCTILISIAKFLILLLLDALLPKSIAIGAVLSGLIGYVAIGFVGVYVAAFNVAFSAAVCRILYFEKQKAMPGFQLIKRIN